ncbi:A/G-specific adenine glycosylase [Hydrogenophaga laconesensis]|uniref:Adenine DNA glycosylase n=1 Tax=Hydrogenophaga laconesensis TaxID=1805971 RepID=A0ABU1VD82_9BURK|nr:A/G-specific adenine glycosylase [Hydrogenophaga laconesensis]MDR7095143.1 A/G-specific adenine glycosylase [Hydrogenophaga laconesensis]
MSRTAGSQAPTGWGLPIAFASLLIEWQRHSGRSGLPWQLTREPYRVWLSEVMLQQTQVSTVLSYYPRFLARFPDVRTLAAASPDDVMALWSGLGYYSRARNLHRCAQVVVNEHGGAFPTTAAQLETLPGIGASTAAAIAAFCHGERISILDGNVRRVLSRLLAFEGDLAQAGPQRELWRLAQALLPVAPERDDMTAYTQGLMDLGATVCLRSKPLCGRCPVRAECRAHAANETQRFPVKTRRLQRRFENWWLLLVRHVGGDGQVRFWLARRPDSGIWAGLYCPPVFADDKALQAAVHSTLGGALHALAPVAHSLTHRELRLHPLLLDVPSVATEDGLPPGQWVSVQALADHGLPAPVRQMLSGLDQPGSTA